MIRVLTNVIRALTNAIWVVANAVWVVANAIWALTNVIRVVTNAIRALPNAIRALFFVSDSAFMTGDGVGIANPGQRVSTLQEIAKGRLPVRMKSRRGDCLSGCLRVWGTGGVCCARDGRGGTVAAFWWGSVVGRRQGTRPKGFKV